MSNVVLRECQGIIRDSGGLDIALEELNLVSILLNLKKMKVLSLSDYLRIRIRILRKRLDPDPPTVVFGFEKIGIQNS
jgi:hypothetical protein